MCHEREPLPLHPVAPGPHAGHVCDSILGAVLSDGVALHLLGRLERLHAVTPLAQERLAGIDLDGGRGGAWLGRGDRRGCGQTVG